MTNVILGQNKFENCRTLIGRNDHAILSVEGEASTLRLDTRDLDDAVKAIFVERGAVVSGDGVRLVSSESGVAVFVDEQAILFLTILDEETLHLKLDLRALGLNIYDDVEGLHAGRNIIAHNSFSSCEVAVRLA